MDDHMMDELTLEQRRQMEKMQRTQTVDQRMTQDETQHMGQGLATAQREQKDLSVLQQIDAIPVSCCKTEQELDEEVEAAGKLGRRAVLESQQDERRAIQEQRQEYVHFYQLAEDYPNRLTAQLEQTEIYNEDTVSKALESCVDGLETHKLLKGNVQDDSGITELCKVFEQLRATPVDTVTAERMEQLHAAYLKLGYADADLIGKQYFDTEAAKGAYVILFYNVAAQLFELLSGRRKDAVDQEQLARLYGIATTSALAVGTLCASDEFRQQLKGLKEERGRKEQEERERKEQEERERKAKEERERKEQEERERKAKEERERKAKEERERKEQEALARNLAYIRQGTLEDGETPAEWPMADYAEMAERIFGEEKLKTMTLQDVARNVAYMQKYMEGNQKLIAKAAVRAGDVYQLPVMHEALKAKLTELIGDNLLKEEYTEEKMQELVKEAKEQMPQKYAVYQKYFEYLTTDELFSQIPDVCQNEQLQAYMTGVSIEQFRTDLVPLREQIRVNLEIVRQQIVRTLAEPLQDQAQQAFLKREGTILLNGSPREIHMKLDWYLTYLREYEPELFDKKNGVDKEHYRKKPKQLTEKSKEEPSETRDLHAELAGELLFGWAGFDGVIASQYTGDPVKVLEKALEKQSFPQEYLKNVRCVADLEALQEWQLSEFMASLRANLAETLAAWSRIKGPIGQKLRDDLFPGMLDGSIREDNFQASMEELLKQYDNEQELQRQRRNVLIGLNNKPHGEIQFRYLDVMINTAIHAEARNITRSRRLQNAALARQIVSEKLHDGTYDYEIRQAFIGKEWKEVEKEQEQPKKEKKPLQTQKPLTKKAVLKVYESVNEARADTIRDNNNNREREEKERKREARKKKETLTETDIQNEQEFERGKAFYVNLDKEATFWMERLKKVINEDNGCGLELLISGVEDLLLRNEEFRRSFSADPRDVYEEKLSEWANVYQHRRSIISSKFYKGKEVETLREALVGLEVLEGEDVEARKKRNLERFGVEGFAELVDCIKEYRQAPESAKKEVAESVQRYEKRLGQLCGLRGGLYEPLKDQLVEDKKVFEALTIIPDAAYESFLVELDQRLFPPMQELDRSYGIKSGFVKQIVLEYGSSILHETKDRSQWKKLFSDYYRQINDYMIGDHSISGTFRTIVQKQQAIAPYLIAILMDEKYGSMILADEKRWEEEVKKYRTNIEANEKELAEHVPDQEEYKELKRNLLVPIATKTAEEFKEALSKYLEDYRKQKIEVQKDVVRATEVMEDRRWTLLTVEVKKERGRKSDEKDREVLRSMKYAKERLTPVIMMYRKDHAPVPDCKTIEKASKAVKKALGDQIAELPDIVTDLLTERVVADASGMNEAALRREAAHLQELYKKIAAGGFGEKYKNSKDAAEASEKMDERMQESLLTYLYCKEKIEQTQGAGSGYEAHMQTKDDGSGFEAYMQTEKLLVSVKKLPVSGKFAAREKEELLNAAQMARYTMPEKDFAEFVTRRMHYVERFDKLEPVCGQIAEEFEKNRTQAQALKLGLLVYYREELNGGQPLDIAALSDDMKKLLEDEHARTYLAQTKAQLLEETGSDALTEEEQQTDTVMDREHFEQELETLLDKDAKKQYNPLSVQQRMIFALALCVPGMDTAVSGLAGYRLVREEGDGDAELLAIHTQVQHYINYDAFAPDIDYAKAFYRLKTGKAGKFGKKELNQTVFKQAMTFVQTVENSRKAQYEPDYARLSDAKATIAAAKTYLGKTSKKVKKQPEQDRIETMDQFFERLTELDEMSKEQQKRLEKIKNNPVSAFRLIQILQDRTVVDYSTSVGTAQRAQGEVTLFVNEGKRLAMLEQAEKGADTAAQTSVHFDQALQTLLSYQLRNDIPILGDQPTEGSFAEGALERKTAVDWELLDRAMKFVDEMNRAQMRMNAIMQAPKLIDQSKNKMARATYHDYKVHTKDEFEEFLKNQAEMDGKLAVLAGYQMLNDAQRELFIKALGSRWVLDVSKEHIMANRFGMMERDYADPAGRDALSDEYFENAMSAAPGVELSESAYEEAFAGILSTQVDDSLDYSNLKYEDLSKHLSRGEQLVGDSRQTPVDWKLVMRALQLAHRCANESEIYAGDWELYVSQGDLSKTGQFEFESAYMRRNLHNAGNRLTRHLGRRVAENVMDQLPGPLLTIVRASISVNANNALAQYAAFEKEEEKQNFAETAAGLMETAGGMLENKVGDVLGKGSEAIGYGVDVKNIIEAGQNVKQLKKAVKEAKRFDEKDEQKMTEAAARQSSRQAAVSRSAKWRNEVLLGDAVKKAGQRQTDQIVDSMSSIFSRALGSMVETGGDTLGTVATEVGKIINLIRNYQNDKASVKAYFESMGELQKLRRKMESEKEMEKLYHESDPLELIRQARGYENYTEMASFVGLNVTRSLLFCASAFNRQEVLRIAARETLKKLGMEDVIGKWDNDSAERVYEAIMGSEYR